ncbi:glycosyltransferase family 2 protein [Pyruvatibacter sp.]|uniref:glycosyltransferase family 2 protein n=1 Tax=Pyruvatibacter sp. TaxID=1981328 RepID=UPI0032F0160A
MHTRLTVVTVTHNGGLVIGGLLDSLPAQIPLVVVDNASTDNTLDIIASKRPNATVLRNEIGQGYGRGASRGLNAVETEFALLANPDSVLSEDAIKALLAAADTYPDAAMFGPVHKTGDGRIEPSHDVELWRRHLFGKRDGEVSPDGDICVEFVSGAVNLVRMDVMRKVGFYDPEVFLYFEDDDMCMRIRRAGYSVVVVAQSVVVHLNSGSVRPNASYYWEKFWHIAWSRIHIERKYRGQAAAMRLAAVDTLRYGVKAVANAIVFRGFQARRDAARCAGTWAALWGVRAIPPEAEGHL